MTATEATIRGALSLREPLDQNSNGRYSNAFDIVQEALISAAHGSLNRLRSGTDHNELQGNFDEQVKPDVFVEDPRFMALINAVALVFANVDIKIDASTLPPDLTKIDLQVLERLALDIGIEIDRRKQDGAQ